VRSSGAIFKSDSLGRLDLPVNENSTEVLVSAVGFESKEIKLLAKVMHVDIVLQAKENVLEEVQISTGYQTIPKDRATGSFGQLSNKELNHISSKSILDRLEGKVAGLQYDNRSGKPILNIRGLNTFNALGSQPLIVVDNFPYAGQLEDLNPNDIESISVLKDGAAASIWGTRAGNGVIVIKTKRSDAKDRPIVNFSTSLMLGDKPDLFYYKTMNSKDFIGVERVLFEKGYYDAQYSGSSNKLFVFSPIVDMLFANKAGKISLDELNKRIETLETKDYRNDLMKYVYQTSVNQQYFIDVASNASVSKNRFSVGYDRGRGDVRTSSSERLTLRATNNWQISKKLNVENVISFINSKSGNSASIPTYPNSPGGGKSALYPYAEFVDVEGNNLAIPKNYNTFFVDTAGRGKLLDWSYKPLEDIDKSTVKNNNRHLALNVKIGYDIFQYLKGELIYGYENQTAHSETLMGEESYYSRDLINRFTQIVSGVPKYILPVGGILMLNENRTQSHRARGQLNFNKIFGTTHSVNALIGGEWSNMNTDMASSGSYGYNPNVLTRKSVDYVNSYPIFGNLAGYGYITPLDSYAGALSRTVSMYFNGMYTYRDKYGLSLSARKDASNSFGSTTNNKWNPLWSSGLSWQIAREKFLKKIVWLDQLRLRTTWGFSGIQPGNAVNQTIIRFANNAAYSNLPYANIVTPPNPSLKWETVRMVNLGLDISLWKGKLAANLEYYRKKSFDLLSSDPVDPTTGYTTLTKNVGVVLTKGLDLTISSKGDFGKGYWQSTINFSYSNNKVTDFKGNIGATAIYMEGGQSISPILGKSLYPVFSYKWSGLDPLTGDPQGIKNGGISKDYKTLIADSLQYLNYHGSALPPIYGSWGNTMGYGNFYLNVSLLFKAGHYFKKKTIVYNSLFGSWDGHADFEKRWQNPGDEQHTDVPSMVYPFDTNRDAFYRNSSVNILKGDLIRLQNIKFGYHIKMKNSRIKAQVHAAVNNVGLIWKKNIENLDPDYLNLPVARIWSIGGNVNF